MHVTYICKVCGQSIASATARGDRDVRLGLDTLTDEEHSRTLSIEGEMATVHSYCDTCLRPAGTAAPLTVIH